MRTRMLVPAVAFALAVAVPATGAVETGQYAGVSQAKVITRYGQLEPEVQKGTVAFRVRATQVTGFKLRKQRAQCPGTPGAVVVDVTIASMPLSGAGVATGSVTNPVFGPITVRVKVTGKGTATGKVRFPANCRTTATFAAAKR
jgi:hypothetical protein